MHAHQEVHTAWKTKCLNRMCSFTLLNAKKTQLEKPVSSKAHLHCNPLENPSPTNVFLAQPLSVVLVAY